MNKSIFVNQSSKAQIDHLRMQEYAKASGFAVDLSTLKWRESDDDSFVMAAESNGELISTMRGEIISDQLMLEKKLECPWDFPLDIQFPVLLLSRAATLSSHRSLGLNLVLRYWFLKFAEHHKLPFVIGTFVKGSPRENTLSEMGFQFFENTLGWQQSTYRSLRPVNVVALDMQTHSKQAMHVCEQKVPEAIEAYFFEGNFPQLKTVNTL